jgi:hypothetical protein
MPVAPMGSVAVGRVDVTVTERGNVALNIALNPEPVEARVLAAMLELAAGAHRS